MTGGTWTREDSEAVAEAVHPVVVDVLRLDRAALESARRELRRYEAAGPLTDPTGWMENREATDRALKRLDALIDCYDRLVETDAVEADLTIDQRDALGDSQAAVMEADGDG